jgi:hypothetical protein
MLLVLWYALVRIWYASGTHLVRIWYAAVLGSIFVLQKFWRLKPSSRHCIVVNTTFVEA